MLEPIYSAAALYLTPNKKIGNRKNPWKIPMGALTLKPQNGSSRDWELFHTNSFDLTDGFGTALRIAAKDNKIFFAEPADVSIPWITDRGRLFYEGTPRLPLTDTRSLNRLFIEYSNYLTDKRRFKSDGLSQGYLTVILKRVSLESLSSLQFLESSLPSVNLRLDIPFRQDTSKENAYITSREFRLANLLYSSLVILIGVNPRYEGYVFNLMLRQRSLKGYFKIVSFGPILNLSLPLDHADSSSIAIVSLMEGSKAMCRRVMKSTLPLFLTSSEFFRVPGYSRVSSFFWSSKISRRFLSGLSLMSGRLELVGINQLRAFRSLDLKDYKDSIAFYYINTDLMMSDSFNKFVNYHILFPRPAEALDQLFLEQTDAPIPDFAFEDAVLDVPAHSVKSDHFLYKRIPVRFPFEEDQSYINTIGEMRRLVHILRSEGGCDTNTSVLKFFFYIFGRLRAFSSRRSGTFIASSRLLSEFNQSVLYKFLSQPTITLISTAKFLRGNPSVSRFFAQIQRYKFIKSCPQFLKLKYWLDDFFTGGDKDPFSSNSANLRRCSELARLCSANFF